MCHILDKLEVSIYPDKGKIKICVYVCVFLCQPIRIQESRKSPPPFQWVVIGGQPEMKGKRGRGSGSCGCFVFNLEIW